MPSSARSAVEEVEEIEMIEELRLRVEQLEHARTEAQREIGDLSRVALPHLLLLCQQQAVQRACGAHRVNAGQPTSRTFWSIRAMRSLQILTSSFRTR